MGIFDGYLICTDCDGTMTNRAGKLSAENAEAIRYFQREGGLFTVATGRFPKHVATFADDFKPNTYQVVGNGTTIYDVETGQVLHEVTMEPPEEAIRYVAEQGLCHLIFVDHLHHSVQWTDGNIEKPALKLEPVNLDVLFQPEDEGWHKVNFCFQDPEETVRVQRLMKEKFPQYKFERSWATGMELLPMAGGKGAAVRKLRELLGSRVHTVIGVGDYENDVSLLKVADIGYAVANATELCRQAADRITVDCDHHAIAAIIDELKEDMR